MSRNFVILDFDGTLSESHVSTSLAGAIQAGQFAKLPRPKFKNEALDEFKALVAGQQLAICSNTGLSAEDLISYLAHHYGKEFAQSLTIDGEGEKPNLRWFQLGDGFSEPKKDRLGKLIHEFKKEPGFSEGESHIVFVDDSRENIQEAINNDITAILADSEKMTIVRLAAWKEKPVEFEAYQVELRAAQEALDVAQSEVRRLKFELANATGEKKDEQYVASTQAKLKTAEGQEQQASAKWQRIVFNPPYKVPKPTGPMASKVFTRPSTRLPRKPRNKLPNSRLHNNRPSPMLFASPLASQKRPATVLETSDKQPAVSDQVPPPPASPENR